MSATRIRVSFKRNDLVCVIWALEAVIEDFKYEGGLVMAEDELRIRDRLNETLRRHDHAALVVTNQPATAST